MRFRCTTVLFLLPFLFALPFLFTLPVCAQIGVYGEFSAARSNLGQPTASGWLRGAVLGAYVDSRHFVVLEPGIDARAVFLERSNLNLSFTSLPSYTNEYLAGGFIGPRLAVHVPALPLRPYGEALIGAAVTGGIPRQITFFPKLYQTSLAYQLIVGADFAVIPHLDWRVAEFTFTGIPNISEGSVSNSAHSNAISTGLVLRF